MATPEQKEFFDELMVDSKTLIFDLSSIFSFSENLQYAEKGYNAEHLYLKQINFMLFFSMDKQLPVLLKPLPGSVRDVKALRAVIDEVNAKDSTVVIDRGFASHVIPDLLTEFDFNFILPLRRNFIDIDYGRRLDYTFSYRNRGIKWGRKRIGANFLYLFEDVKLRAEEETTFIHLMNEKKRTTEEYKEESQKFGKIAILSNRDEDGETIYLMWKDRENIEVAFDALKNELENDKTYLDDDDAVRGYFFISFLSLYLYYKILNLLRKAKLVDKVSVNEVLLELSKVYEIHIGEKRKLSEIPDLYIRGSIATALNVIAHQHQDKKEEIKAFLSKLIDDTNDPTFAAFLVDELLSFKDPNFLPQVRKAFEDGRIDTEVISQDDVDWVFDLSEKEQSYFKFMRSPLEHFSRENISHLRKISYPEKETPAKKIKTKIGRNDPCPCGSGKKYKKCCMKK